MKKEENRIALPGGEWLKPLQSLFATAGISWLQDSERNYLVRFPDLDLSGTIVRTKNVPELVDRLNSPAIAGFTGSDILVEMGVNQLSEESGWEVPLNTSSNPNAKVYLGFTQNAFEQFGPEPSLAQVMEGVHRLSIS